MNACSDRNEAKQFGKTAHSEDLSLKKGAQLNMKQTIVSNNARTVTLCRL